MKINRLLSFAFIIIALMLLSACQTSTNSVQPESMFRENGHNDADGDLRSEEYELLYEELLLDYRNLEADFGELYDYRQRYEELFSSYQRLEADNSANICQLQRLSGLYDHILYEITPTLTPDAAYSIIFNTDRHVIRLISDGDIANLAEYVHPVRGVRLSFGRSGEALPTDRIIEGEDFLLNNTFAWVLAPHDAPDAADEMSVAELFDRHVYTRDFIAETAIYNPFNQIPIIDGMYYIRGNEYVFYDNAIVVLYLYRGDEDIQHMDWGGLILIYQEHSDGNWYLSGITIRDRH